MRITDATGTCGWHMRRAMRLAYARTDGRTYVEAFLTSGINQTFVNARRGAA